MSVADYPHVFTRMKVGNLELKNRIHFTPLVACASMADGEVNEEMLEWIRYQAKTGAAYITIGDTQIDLERARCFYGELNVTEDKYNAGLALLPEEAHRFGCKLSIELSHAGRGADPLMNPLPAFAPSDIPLEGCQQNLKVMDKVDMEWVKKRWAECARRCKDAGFDMVMFHSAHNNLMGQFLSPASNARTDEYGGILENRMRYPLEVAKALREAVGPDFPIEIRVSAQDAQFGLTLEDTIAYLKEAQKYVNLVCVSNGNEFSEDGTKWLCPSYLMPHKLNADYAGTIKKALNIPVQVVGNVYNIKEAEQILSEGKADIVGICRSFIADPELLIKAAEGREQEIRPCLRCMDGCGLIYHGKQIRCAVNPTIGRETRFKNLIPAETPKKVFVIGGGAAGMSAATTLAKRGHHAVLFEKQDKLGGILYDAGSLPFKNELLKFNEYLIHETEKSGAEIRLNTICNAETVKDEKPDVVIVATGSSYIRPQIDGINNDNVFMAREVDDGSKETGQRVVICGGGLTGIETAIQLGRKGKDVTVVDMIPANSFIKNKFYIIRNSILAEAAKAGVKMAGDSKVLKFDNEGVHIDHLGERTVLPADSIVIAFGTKSENKIYDEIYPLMPLCIYKIGDSARVANIMNAVQSGYDVAYDL